MLHTDKGKGFLNKLFHHILQGVGIQFQVSRIHDLGSAVVGRVHRKIRDTLYKYFTYKNT